MFPKDFLSLLSSASSPDFLISTHKFCDGDGLGAGLALCHALKNKGRPVTFLTLEEPHKKYKFMDKKGLIRVFEEGKTYIPKGAALIIVDANDKELIEPLYSTARRRGCSVYFIDHHPLARKIPGDRFFINAEAASTAELVHLLFKKMDVFIDSDMAECLFSSLVFDTNLFRYVKNSSRPFALAAELVPKIKSVDRIYDHLFKTLTTDNIRFMGKLENVEYYFDSRVAFLHLKEGEFKEYNTDMTKAYDLIDIVRNVDSIESTALVIENGDGSLKLSLRSKSKDLLPLARKLGGGGHCHSAGAWIKGKDLKTVKRAVLSYLK